LFSPLHIFLLVSFYPLFPPYFSLKLHPRTQLESH
jgi:hypothetical protein